MRMRVSVVVVLFSAFILSVLSLSNEDFLPAVQYGGFNVIFSNDTSYLDEIDSHGDVMYVSGQGIVREVIHDPFSLDYDPRFFLQSHRFIDFRAFSDTNNKTWVFGPTTSHHIPNPTGFSHPFQLASLDSSYSQGFSQAGVLYSSVIVHTTSAKTHIAYTAGWAMQGSAANFVIARLTITPETVSSSNSIFFTSESPLTLNTTSGYEDFDRTFKPKIFRNGNQSYVIVVDPSSRCVYKVSTSSDDSSSPAPIAFLGSIYIGGQFGGATFDPEKEVLYIGLVAVGTSPGYIAYVDTSANGLSIIERRQLYVYQSNPTSLFIRDGFLYIGFSGGVGLIRLQMYTHNSPEYSTVPYYLRNVAAIHVKHDNVYFVTYDQFAKVAKIDMNHFCNVMCDTHFGYCENGDCKCQNGTTLALDAKTCLPTPDLETYQSTHAGEVALGLLFAVTLVAALIGWFLLWKVRRSGVYTRPGRSGSMGLNDDESDRFLANEDN